MAEASADDTGPKSFMSTSPKFDFSDPNTFHDRVLLVEDRKFYVQSTMLMVWSEYFKGLFGSDFKEAKDEEIEIKDVSAEDFSNFLMLVYPTKLKVNENNYEGLIKLAHRFLAPRVLECVQEFLMENFEKQDKIALLKLAFQHEMVELKEMLAAYICAQSHEYNGHTCNLCHFIAMKKYCPHNITYGRSPNYRNTWIAKNIDIISELPSEIQTFILRSSVQIYL